MLYVSSSCIKGKNIADIICRLAEHDVKNIELSGGTGYYSELKNDLINLKQFWNLNYVCHAYFPPPKNPFVVNLASCNDDIYQQSIEHYMHCIELLKRINSRVLSIHAGFLIEIGTTEIGNKLNHNIVYEEKESYDRFCKAYAKIAKSCADNGIELFLENNVLNTENYKEFEYQNYMMMTDYDSILKMKEQIEFQLLLDLGHLHVSSKTLGLNYTEECAKLRKYVKWIHLSDNNGIIDEHKPLKRNSVILEEFIKMYHTDINVTLETVGEMEDIISSIELAEASMVMAKEE